MTLRKDSNSVDALRAGEPTTLAECPPGLFVFEGELAVKTRENLKNGRAQAYSVSDGEFFMGGSSGAPRESLVVRPVRPAPAPYEHPVPDDWTLDDTATADEILLLLGIGSDASKEPGADWRRDRIAAIIRKRTDEAVRQEREGSAFAVECHSGFGDLASIEACAELVRARGEEQDECIHLVKPRYAAIMESLYRMVTALEALGMADEKSVAAYRTVMENARRLTAGTAEPPELRPLPAEETTLPKNGASPKFKVGDEVERVSGGEWLGMKVGDCGVVTEVRPTANNWHQIKIDGYYGLYSDFRYKLVKRADGESAATVSEGVVA